MNTGFFDLIDATMRDTAALSLPAFRTELVLCATIVLMLLSRLFRVDRWIGIDAWFIALAGSLVGLWMALPWTQPASLLVDGHVARHEIFTGMLAYDSFTLYFRALLMFFAVVFLFFTRLSGIPDREDAPDFYTLVLGATLGMCIMASANHLLTIFLGVEMASVPSYALAGMLKGRRQSSEAALKYSIYGAGAAGVMLYGISLLAGVVGSCHLPTMANQLAAFAQAGQLGDRSMVLVLGGLMVMVGLAFKLSAVPFHFWCPDVFEGASAEVNAFLSIASKAAALALLVRVAVGFGYASPDRGAPPIAVVASTTNAAKPQAILVAASVGAAPTVPAKSPTPLAALSGVRNFMALLVAFIAAITCTFGNLAAYGQTNIKRLLAYSTIAHAGYMMMPVAAGLVLMGTDVGASQRAFAAIPFYASIYLFMNLGAFAIVAFLRNTLRSEQIADYAGLLRSAPGVTLCFAAILFSLVGLPPLAGFAGKYAIFWALVDGIRNSSARGLMITLLVVGGLNTAVSLFYYLRVVKVMTFEPEPDNRPPFSFPLVSLHGAFIAAVSLPVLALGIWWNDLYQWAQHATMNLLQ